MENFVLRRITSEQHESNEIIGDSYHVLYKESKQDEFDSHCKIIGMDPDMKEECYALLICKDGMESKPLYRKSTYYIMTTDGNTFSNVSYK